jgi:hypothetical protein
MGQAWQTSRWPQGAFGMLGRVASLASSLAPIEATRVRLEILAPLEAMESRAGVSASQRTQILKFSG